MNLVPSKYRYVLAMVLPMLIAQPMTAQASMHADHHQIVADFEGRANRYVDLRQKVAGNSPKPNDSPELITKRQRDLGDKLRVERAGAKQGEIFTPEIARYFRHQLKESMEGKKGKGIRSSLRGAEPVNIELQVNMSYPDSVPLQSTPPSLLRKLPQLPKGLEYRLLNRQLVLRDTEANFVVDYVPNALPGARKR